MPTVHRSPAPRVAVTATFEDVKDEVYKAARIFLKRYGGEYDEVMGRAGELFIDAYYEYANQIEFDRWVYNRVLYKLREDRRKVVSRYNRMKQVAANLTALPAKPNPKFDMEGFLASLSKDARVVVGLVFDTPIDINFSMKLEGGYDPRRFLKHTRQFLVVQGWSSARVSRAFTEVREALRADPGH